MPQNLPFGRGEVLGRPAASDLEAMGVVPGQGPAAISRGEAAPRSEAVMPRFLRIARVQSIAESLALMALIAASLWARVVPDFFYSLLMQGFVATMRMTWALVSVSYFESAATLTQEAFAHEGLLPAAGASLSELRSAVRSYIWAVPSMSALLVVLHVPVLFVIATGRVRRGQPELYAPCFVILCIFLVVDACLAAYGFRAAWKSYRDGYSDLFPELESFAAKVVKIFKYSEASSISDCKFGTTCSICLDDFKLQEELAQLPCKHLFHSECLCKWFDKEVCCPFRCRSAASQPRTEEGRHGSSAMPAIDVRAHWMLAAQVAPAVRPLGWPSDGPAHFAEPDVFTGLPRRGEEPVAHAEQTPLAIPGAVPPEVRAVAPLSGGGRTGGHMSGTQRLAM